MYPNQPPEQQPQQPQSYAPLPPLQTLSPSGGTSYLDSIAAPQKQNTLNPFVLWGIIGGVLLALALFIIFLFNSGGPSPAESFTTYAQRIQALSKLTTNSTKTIQSSELRALNATTSSVLGTAVQESSSVLGAVQLKKVPPAAKGSPVTTEFATMDTKLNDARLNVKYDIVYAREVAYQLAKIRAELSTLYKTSKSKILRTYLEKTDDNLKPLVSQYNEFNNSQG
jgi:hypothetical protein